MHNLVPKQRLRIDDNNQQHFMSENEVSVVSFSVAALQNLIKSEPKNKINNEN